MEDSDRINWLGFWIVGTILISAVVQCLLGFIILITAPSDFWECGNSYLNDRESEAAAFLIMTVYLILVGVISAVLIRQKTSKWLGIVLLITHVFFIVQFFVTGYKALHWNYYYEEVEFSKRLAQEGRSLKMARYLLNYNVLKGKTKKEVLFCLGEGDHYYSNGENIHAYVFGDGYSPLLIEFENEQVLKCYLVCLD